MSARPESDASALDIAQIEKSFPAPPKSSHGSGVDKSLPPLPLMADIEKAAEETAATQTNSNTTRTGTNVKRWTPRIAGSEKELPLPLGISTWKSPRPLSKDEPRPTTATTYTSIDPKRNLKYGVGKYTTIELSPQPSEDPEDPLNWPLWKKNLNFAALVSMVAIVGAMKTALVSVHSVIAEDEGIDYTAAVALTAAPLIISAVTGMACTIIGRIWGKRPVYLVSMVLLFIGCAWNTNTRGQFAQDMAARVFQGLGWGAFDTLVLGSILDTYFEHERQPKILIYHAISFGSTWGTPLFGGAVSMAARGFLTQFEVLTVFMVLLMPLVVLGAPETTYKRSSFDDQDAFPMLTRSLSRLPTITLTKDAALQYLRSVDFQSYKAIIIDRELLLQAPRAALAPSTILLFAITLLPYVTLWGLYSSLSLLFSPQPYKLDETSIGLISFAPLLFGTTAVAGIPLLLRKRYFTRTLHLVVLVVGTAFALIGILGFGLYIVGTAGPDHTFATMDSISFPVISFLLGFLALGSAALDSTIYPLVEQSTAFTSPNMNTALRNIADMHTGLAVLRKLVAGIFILGLPSAFRALDGLQNSAIGMDFVQLFVTAAVATVHYKFGEHVRRLDGQVMGLVDLGSFFDSD
ncbi:hypothetical protein F4808DRAFT_412205 [Astrocystis sublimbata]|nr:hypothetical protein F4808DRAFT_412205 [Astrocystis sublimbata]